MYYGEPSKNLPDRRRLPGSIEAFALDLLLGALIVAWFAAAFLLGTPETDLIFRRLALRFGTSALLHDID